VPSDEDLLPVPAEEPVLEVRNEDVIETYDRFARAYDWLVAPLEANTRERAVSLLGVDHGDTVVELGCGPGFAMKRLGQRVGPDGKVLGVDAAPRMVRRARRRARRKRLGDWTDATVGDARAVPLPDDAVDAVFLEDTLELFDEEDRETVLAEAKRILRDGGRLGVVAMERSEAEADAFVRAWDWAFERVPGFERLGSRPVDAQAAVRSAGFEVRVEEHHERAKVWPVEILICTVE
jgi:ubiquinone/menaquinone biosynthesis C-methylase UbiE